MEPHVTARAGFRDRSSLRLARAGTGDADPTDGRAERAAAVTALYAQHALGLTRLAYIMLGSQTAAEDVVQDAFCGLYRRWPHLSDQAKALSYARSSVLNGCRSALRLRPTVELQEAHQPPAGSAETVLLTAEERGEVLRALRRLPDRQREVLTLRYYLDVPDDQIAAAMGIGRGTVRSAAHRGLIALRQALKETS
jgi:RNA polymerase sigma-70 factor (sigma-E family)